MKSKCRFRLLLVSFFSFSVIACSSVDKTHYYKFHQETASKHPELSYERTSVWDGVPSTRGFPLKIIYKEKFRSIVSLPYFQYLKVTFKNHGYRTVTWGPIFLPIIPNFGDFAATEEKLDEEALLEFSINFVSSDEFGPVNATLPDLDIVDSTGKVLKPQSSTFLNGFKTFKYGVKVKDLPHFTLRPASMSLSDGTTVAIPEIKFTLEKELAFNFALPIAP